MTALTLLSIWCGRLLNGLCPHVVVKKSSEVRSKVDKLLYVMEGSFYDCIMPENIETF